MLEFHARCCSFGARFTEQGFGKSLNYFHLNAPIQAVNLLTPYIFVHHNSFKYTSVAFFKGGT